MPHLDEAARQRELDSQHLVDSLPEAAFDDIVRLAALICDAPIALVTLIHRDRQWFKASTGIDATGTRRDEAFCNHAIATPDRLMEVPDAHEDTRFVGNRLVVGPDGIRYYAGMPLVSPKGAAFGTVCVLDHKPRLLVAEQKEGLAALGRLTTALFEARHQRLGRERAEVLQQALHAPLANEDAETGTAAATYSVVLVELQDAAGTARTLGDRAFEALLQRFAEHLQAQLGTDSSVDRVTGSHEVIVLLRGDDIATQRQALDTAVASFEREHGVTVLSADAVATRADEDVMAVYLRAEAALSAAKDRA